MTPEHPMTDAQIAALLARLAATEERLVEAEATLRALRQGELDGLATHTRRDDGLHLAVTNHTAGAAPDAEIFPLNQELEARVTARTVELLQANDALRKSRDQFTALLTNVDSGVALVDEHGRFTIVNPQFLRLFGIEGDPADILNINSQDWSAWQVFAEDGTLLHVDDHPVRKAAITGKAVRNQLVGVRLPSGDDPIWMLVSATPILKPDGGIEMLICTYHDITERKYAEEALWKSEQRVTEILESIHDGFFAVDNDWRLTYVNQQAAVNIGLTPEEMVGNTIWDAFPHICGTVQETQYRKAMTERIPLTFELKGLMTPKWYEIRCHPTAEGLSVYCIDTTARKLAEEALRESEERYRYLFNVMPSGVAVYQVKHEGLDVDGKDFIFRDMNPAGEQIDHVHKAEIVGKSLYDCFPNVREMGLVDVFRRVWQTGTPEYFPVTLYTDDKLSLWVTNYVWRLPTGELVALFDDITERKQAEEALRESEHHERERAVELATLLDAMPTPVFIVHDPDSLHMTGNHAADELLHNPRGAEASLSAPVEVKPRHFKAIKDGRELRLDELPAQRAARGAQVRDFEFSLVFDDGMVRHVLGYGTPLLDEQGCPRGAVHVLVDITARKHMEEALQASLHEKEVLLKEIHHRVKNNMQVISSLVSLQADTLDDPALRPLFNDLRDQVRTMALVHEKLYQSASLAHVDFAEYTQSLLAYLWRAHGDAAAPIRLTLDVQPVSISIEQAVPCGLILNELITNTLKHAFRARDGGEVTVTLHAAPDGQVCLGVRDNGVGLPADWRQSPSLGLRLVQMLAGQVRGTLDVRTDGGTAFALTFAQPTIPHREEDRHA